MEIMDDKDEVFNLDTMQDDFLVSGEGDRPHVFRSSLSGTLPKFQADEGKVDTFVSKRLNETSPDKHSG
jgi:hypothetical protein